MASTSMRLIVLGLALLLATVSVAPTASAERITGCVDGWDRGDADCAAGDHVPDVQCLAFRECGPPS